MQAAGDLCLYIASEGEMLLIVIYVDDILFAGKNEKDEYSHTSPITEIPS